MERVLGVAILVPFLLVGLVLLLAGVIALRYWWVMRRLDPVGPTGVEPGLREFEGRARSVGETVTAPFSGSDALVCEWEILRYDEGDGTNWQTAEAETLTAPFEIEHDGSTVGVDPAGADHLLADEFELDSRYVDELPPALEEYVEEHSVSIDLGAVNLGDRRHRFVERRLDPDERVYVLGPVERGTDDPAASTAQYGVSAELDGWLSGAFSEPFVVSDGGETTAQCRQLKRGIGGVALGAVFSAVAALGLAVVLTA